MSEILSSDVLKLKLSEIVNILTQKIEKEFKNNPLDHHLGVLSGASGISLFLFYAYKLSGDEKHFKTAEKILTYCINSINSGNTYPTYCSGISGLGWVFNHIQKLEIIDIDDELLIDLDVYLFEAMLLFMKEKNYDFLHGAIGCGFYFLKRYETTHNGVLKERYKDYLVDLIKEIDRLSEKKNDIIRWPSVVKIDLGIKGYNLGLSHGIPSIVNFFSRLYAYDDFKNGVNDMLRGGVNYLLSQTSNDSSSLSVFPNYVCDAEKPEFNSRVAWCYGDLGIAISIWHAGKALNDEYLKKIAIDTLRHTTLRTSNNITLVIDAGLCHGSFGNAQKKNS